MDYNFKLDVSHLVAKVKQHNLLFYPAMIHILVSALKRHDNHLPVKPMTIYTLVTPNGHNMKLWHEYHDNFLPFFEHYVRNCYRHMAEEGIEADDSVPLEGILVSAQPPLENYITANDYPEFYLSAFEEQNGKIWQNVMIKAKKQFDDLETFARNCQKMCDMFQEKV